MILHQGSRLKFVIFFTSILFTPCFSVKIKEPILITTQKNMSQIVWNPIPKRSLLAVAAKQLKIDILDMNSLQSIDIITLEAGRFLQHIEWSPDGRFLIAITQQCYPMFSGYKEKSCFFLSIFEFSDEGKVIEHKIENHPFESPVFYAKPYVKWDTYSLNFQIITPENNGATEFLYTFVENFEQPSQESIHIHSKRESINCQELFHNVQLFNLIDPITDEDVMSAIIKDGLFMDSESDLFRYMNLPGSNDTRVIKQSSDPSFLAVSYKKLNKIPDNGLYFVSIYDQYMNKEIATISASDYDWHPDSYNIMTYSHANIISLYDITKKEKLATAVIEDIRDQGRYIPMTMQVAWSPTGKELVSATQDGRVYWYQVEL